MWIRTRFVEKEERKLWEAFQQVEPKASKHIGNGNYAKALRALSSLRPQVDSFFDEVMVMAKGAATSRESFGSSQFPGLALYSSGRSVRDCSRPQG